MAQFGNTDSAIVSSWAKYKVPDEPVIKSNMKGTLSFARAGKDTKGNALFINLKNNQRPDSINYVNVVGFSGLGTVTKGMEVV